MQSDYYINLHFNQAVAQRTGYAFKIGDKGCTFHLHCEDLDPSDMFPHIVFNHPNNTCVEGVPTGSGRDYAYTIAGNEFGVCGKTVVDLKFYDNNNDATQRISTASFMIEIIPDTYTDFEESSSSYADSLERAREEIDAAILDLQGAEHDLEEAEGDLDNMSGQFADTLQDYIDAFGNTAPINPRGAYVAATEYHPRDAVEYTAGGKTLTYINRETCTGIAPTDPDYGAHYWQIMIDVSVGGSFSALSDVSVDPQTLADGQVPVYDATGQVWENKTILENSLTSTATDLALTAAKGKELQDNKQAKTLETPITVAGTSKTTVETALDGINDYVDDSVAAIVDVYGAKNICDLEGYLNKCNVAFTKSGNAYSFTMNSTFYTSIFTLLSHDTALTVTATSITGDCYTSLIDENDTPVYEIAPGSNINVTQTFSKIKFAPALDLTTVTITGLMIRDARISDNTVVPYAKTNIQLTVDKAEKSQLSNRNLLDNPWFTVNQRGITSATIVNNTYYFDRWLATYATNTGTIEAVSGGVKLTPAAGDYVYIKQRSEIFTSLYGKVITASVLLSDGTIKSGTITRTSGTTQDFIDESNIRVRIVSNNDFEIRVGTTITIRAVKLEVGTASTLQLDVAPDYTTELLKCQRYFQRIAARENYAILATGVMDDATALWGQIPLTVPLRATPTVSTAGTFNIRHGGSLKNVSSVTLELRNPTMLSVFVISSTSLTAGTPAQFLFNSTSTYIDLSAEI